jgi:adenosine 3'-phospho 5'-phosphosulfate transporter B2
MDFENYMDFWMGRLLANVLGYATIIVPGYIAVHYIRKTGYLERAGKY